MPKRISQLTLSEFSILHNSKLLAAIYFIATIPFGIMFGVIGMLVPNDKSPFPAWIMIFIPFIYAIAGFIFSALGFAVYNWVAGWMGGGIQFTVDEE